VVSEPFAVLSEESAESEEPASEGVADGEPEETSLRFSFLVGWRRSCTSKYVLFSCTALELSATPPRRKPRRQYDPIGPGIIVRSTESGLPITWVPGGG
jgi:hypothetical protein